MSERLEEIKGDWEAERCIKPENVEFLIGQSERAETLEMKYENSGSMFNRQNMQARIDELEHQNQKYREADEGEFLDNLIGRLYEYENQIIRYREALEKIRLGSKYGVPHCSTRVKSINKIATKALEESE